MDEMRMVRDSYPEPAPPTAREIAQARALLDDPPRRSLPRLRWGLGAVVAVGAAATAAITLTGGSAPARPGPVTLDGRAAVLAAAQQAERQPTGDYWYSDVVQGQSYILRPRTGTYAITASHDETFGWWGARPGMGEGYHGRDLPARPRTAHDAELWRKAGSPSSFRVWSGDAHHTYAAKATKWRSDGPEKGIEPGGGGQFPGGRSVQDLQKLPTDPAELAALFLNPAEMSGPARGNPAGAAPGSPGGDAAIKIMRVSSLLGTTPVPPKVRAGLMRALAAQPGVRSIGRAVDPLGREGVALASGDRATTITGEFGGPKADRGTYRSRAVIIFDGRTGALLSRQEELTKPGARYAEMKPGFIIESQAVRSAAWTGTKPQPPAALPFG